MDDFRYVRAILPYREKVPETDELEFERDDVFKVCNELGDGWLWVINQRTGEQGIVYSDLVTDVRVSILLRSRHPYIYVHFVS